MKRLLLTLSLICFSWGAGANSAYADDYFQLTKSRPTQDCLEAKKMEFILNPTTTFTKVLYTS